MNDPEQEMQPRGSRGRGSDPTRTLRIVVMLAIAICVAVYAVLSFRH